MTTPNIISLCIPRVKPTITKTEIMNIFYKLDVGKIDRIDIINKKTVQGDNYKRVFLHFNHWNNNEYANEVKERLSQGKDIKVVYDFPWFWKISANKY
jgi:hypothetical protein